MSAPKWTVTTVPTSIGSCHKIGPIGEPDIRGRERFACIYDDGSSVSHPRPELIAAANKMGAAPDLYEACALAKKYLEPDLVEPGRTVFWKLVYALAKARGEDQQPDDGRDGRDDLDDRDPMQIAAERCPPRE